MGDTGYNTLCMGHPYPTHYGTVPPSLKDLKPEEIDPFHEMICVDELSRCGSGGVAWGVSGGLTIGLPPVLRYGRKEVADKVVPECLSGKKM